MSCTTAIGQSTFSPSAPASSDVVAADTPQSWIRTYYSAFNGIRGLAILMVFTLHYWPIFASGLPVPPLQTGVDLFFVLSGFLITGLLFDSLDDPHYFRNFYIRRTLRIFPLYYGIFLAALMLKPILHLVWSNYFWIYPLYIGNLTALPLVHHHVVNPTIIWIRRPSGDLALTNVGYFWSLCVEEQFYLLWPAVVFLLRKRDILMRFCLFGIVSVLAIRVFVATRHWPDLHVQIYWDTYTRADTLFAGAFLALWLRGKQLRRHALRRIAVSLLIPFGALYLLIWAIRDRSPQGQYLFDTIAYTFIFLAASGFLLLALDETSWIHRLLLQPTLSRLGAISYGFYLLHSLYLTAFLHLAKLHPGHLTRFAITAAALALSCALAWLSFRFYETPFLRLKSVLTRPASSSRHSTRPSAATASMPGA